MKKEMLFAIMLSAMIILFSSFVSSYTIVKTDVNSTFSIVNVTTAQNWYAYEITYQYSGSVSSVSFYNFLSTIGDGSDSSNGYHLKASNVSIYESKLDSTKTGVSKSAALFNITYSGTLTLKSSLIQYANGDEETTNYNEDGTTTVTVVTSSGGGGGGTLVQHYTLKVVSPGDVTLPEEGVIEVPVTLQNPGNIALKGIKLFANVTFNNMMSKDVSITLAETEIDEIKAGESKTLTIRINAPTKKQGIYKVTVYAEVTEPKFSDWGEFYIEFKKTSESEVDNAISSAEKTIEENVECIELKELIIDAKKLLDERKFTQSAAKIQEFNDLCEKAIYKKSPLKGIARSFDKSIMIYVALATAIAVAIGVGFYIFKKYKFRKLSK